MDKIKKHLGTIWILLGFYAGFYVFEMLAIPKFISGKSEDFISAIIYTFLAPIIAISLIIFGEYAIQDEFSTDKHKAHRRKSH